MTEWEECAARLKQIFTCTPVEEQPNSVKFLLKANHGHSAESILFFIPFVAGRPVSVALAFVVGIWRHKKTLVKDLVVVIGKDYDEKFAICRDFAFSSAIQQVILLDVQESNDRRDSLRLIPYNSRGETPFIGLYATAQKLAKIFKFPISINKSGNSSGRGYWDRMQSLQAALFCKPKNSFGSTNRYGIDHLRIHPSVALHKPSSVGRLYEFLECFHQVLNVLEDHLSVLPLSYVLIDPETFIETGKLSIGVILGAASLVLPVFIEAVCSAESRILRYRSLAPLGAVLVLCAYFNFSLLAIAAFSLLLPEEAARLALGALSILAVPASSELAIKASLVGSSVVCLRRLLKSEK